jgi:hypothetical protein
LRAFASPDVSVNEITSYEMIMQKRLVIFKQHRVERLQVIIKDTEQQGEFTQKKENRKKRLSALSLIFLIATSLQLNAQNETIKI